MMEQPPFQSPEEQQAHASIRGLAYQFWLTVDAWLSLSGDARLFVERAEDFAVFTTEGANVTQAKALAQPISLRSKGVLEAINHLWAFQEKRPGFPLRFAFVTTAEIACEHGDHFSGAAGLKVWRETALSRDLVKTELLRRFLISDSSVAEKLTEKALVGLRGLSTEEFLARFILSLVWDTGTEDHIGVREAVEQRLQNLAVNRFGLNPAQANGLPAVLFTLVMEVAASGGVIALTQALLWKHAEAFFAPQAIAMIASRRAAVLGTVLAGATEAVPWNAVAAVPIRPAEELSRRTATVRALGQIVRINPFVLLAGSTGMGKTTLAQLVSAERGGSWLQLQLGYNLGNALSGLRECIALLDGRSPGLIIDDMPWDELGSAGENILRGFAYVVRQSGARVIFTNQKEPTVRQLAMVGLADTKVERVPTLTSEEIKDVAERLGCADEKVRDQWARLLGVQTLGHPQLVHASLLDLRTRGWLAPTAAEFAAASTVIREERDRNQALLRQLNPEEYELLVRLSVFVGLFRRDQAVSLAGKLEPLSRGAPAFERLRGPWIETVRKDYFRLSPLLSDASASGVSAVRLKELHRAVVEAVCDCQPVSVADVANVLMNAVAGEHEGHALPIIVRLLTVPPKHSRMVHELLRWSLAFTRKKAFPGDDWTEAVFRLMQFVVAANTIPDQASKYFTRVEAAMGGLKPEQVRTLHTLLGMELFRMERITLPLEKVFELVPIVSAAMEEMGAEGKKLVPKLGAPFRAESAGEQVEAAYVMIILNGAKGLSFLEELWQLLDTAKPETRAGILVALGRCRSLVLMAFDHGWLEEEMKPVRSWERALGLYWKFLAGAAKWSDELLGVAAARALAIIHNEYLNDETAALAALGQINPVDPELAGVMAEQRAKAALVNKQYAEATRLYGIALGFPPLPGVTRRPQELILHNAGTAAGYAEQWSASAKHFVAAYDLAVEEKDWVRAGAFASDAGYALWRAGQKQAAIDRLAEALSLAVKMPDFATDIASFKVQKVLGNILLRLAWGEGGRADEHLTSPVLPGMCSDPGTTEAMRTLPPPMHDLAWTFLLVLEFEETASSHYWNEHFQRLLKMPFTGMRFIALELQARKLLREGRLEEMLPLALVMAADVAASARRPKDASFYEWREDPAERQSVTFNLNDSFPIAFFLLCGLTIAILRGNNLAGVFAGWRARAKDNPIFAELAGWMDFVEEAIQADVNAAYKLAATSDIFWQRWAAALRLIREPKLTPEMLAAATFILTLPTWQKMKFEILPDVYRELDPFLSAKWQAACENRFAFRSPTLFVPDIKALAGNPDGTGRHIAKLVLAALPALHLNIPAPMIQQVREMVD